MERTLSTERGFKVAPYEMFTVGEIFTNIPEEFALNTKFVNKVRYLQMASLEYAFRSYMKLHIYLEQLPEEEALQELKSRIEDAQTELQNLIDEGVK